MNTFETFFLGSYLTGFFFMLFLNDKIMDDPCPSSFVGGLLWPITASVFILGRMFKAAYVFLNGSL